MKLYFSEFDDERCYSLDYHIEQARENGLENVILFEAEKYKERDFFFCEEVEEWYAKGGCGKDCIDYSPRNGKSGICKHWSNIAYKQGKRVICNIKTKEVNDY